MLALRRRSHRGAIRPEGVKCETCTPCHCERFPPPVGPGCRWAHRVHPSVHGSVWSSDNAWCLQAVRWKVLFQETAECRLCCESNVRLARERQVSRCDFSARLSAVSMSARPCTVTGDWGHHHLEASLLKAIRTSSLLQH